MDQNITHIYFVPGLAANKEIFKNIQLSEEIFKIHFLEWLLPDEKESLQSYAKRMANRVEEENSVLIGVSFGGVVVQEMSLFLNLKKLIIISSVKTKNELPLRLVLARKTLAYKLVPTRLVLSASDLTKFAIGPKTKKRLEIYQEYLSVRDAHYLDWAIENMVCWDRKIAVDGIIHIHGDEDVVFPIEKIKNCIVVKGGTHIMILNKFTWFNKNLPKLILEENEGK
ncbi:MAG: alpha/beta hydrolase [Bacteroidetes bacterium HGW-Bacteroidetes-2]|jgi:pimeloyl-ACP methyl ester carboxylesterase|nr:MAG: alpha/beta hydrolase [Bacteroidetes bacterium HGW-Bacteroidetes-2]